MIEINLLPEDLKRTSRVNRGAGQRPLILLVVLLAAVAGGMGYFRVAHLSPRRAAHEALASRLAGLRKQADELATLERSIKHVEKRKRALATLYQSRYLWAEKLDQLIDIIPPNVWLRSAKLSAPRRTRTGSGGGIFTLECNSAGAEEKGITLFRERLRANEAFWNDVAAMNRIAHRRREYPEYVEGVALEFTVDLDLKNRVPSEAPPARRTQTARSQ